MEDLIESVVSKLKPLDGRSATMAEKDPVSLHWFEKNYTVESPSVGITRSRGLAGQTVFGVGTV